MVRCIWIFLVITILGCSNDDPAHDPIKQLQTDIERIDNYISDNGLNAIKDPRGIRIVILSLGTAGLPPKVEQTVVVQSSGKLLAEGTTFDSGNREGLLSGFIPGWQAGLSMMPEGTRALLFIPSGLAYGPDGFQNVIPPNANLMFDIELQDVKKSAAETQRLSQDMEAIDAYLASNHLDAETDASGLRYHITQDGTGTNVTWYDKVKISYSGRLMSNGAQFFSGVSEPSDDFDSRVVNYILGFQAGLQKMKKGSKATFYIPSGLAFGTQGAGNGIVPANANVIYEMELLEIIE